GLHAGRTCAVHLRAHGDPVRLEHLAVLLLQRLDGVLLRVGEVGDLVHGVAERRSLLHPPLHVGRAGTLLHIADTGLSAHWAAVARTHAAAAALGVCTGGKNEER